MSRPILRIWVNPACSGLRTLYEEHIRNHNNHVQTESHPNSGFDLFVPSEVLFEDPNKAQLVNHQIKAVMYNTSEDDTSSAYLLYPRSSIYKTPLSLANSVGVIDSGYRGFLCSALRFLPNGDCLTNMDTLEYVLEQNTKISQICHPSLCPFTVELVDQESVLESTTRAEGGFGSTGV
jgi:dUTPase